MNLKHEYQLIGGDPDRIRKFADELTRTHTPFEWVNVRTGKATVIRAIKLNVEVYRSLLGYRKEATC